MITVLERDELARIGSSHRAEALIAQAGYTLGIATEDGQELADLLDDGLLAEVREAMGEVDEKSKDRANAGEDAKQATRAQTSALREAKVWRRKVAARGRRARRQGHTVADVLTQIGRATIVTDVVKQLGDMAGALEKSLEAMGGQSAKALLDEGVKLREQLKNVDAEQERKRLSDLPDAVRDFCAAKGRLLVGLKVVNDAGHELHADDPAAASRYNLRILHRRAPTRSGSGQEPA